VHDVFFFNAKMQIQTFKPRFGTTKKLFIFNVNVYGHMDQTFFIDDELSKAFRNPKWSRFFLEPFTGCELSNNKVQWLDLISWL
jgi:hypothetical protein